jgi:hypothetical protein
VAQELQLDLHVWGTLEERVVAIAEVLKEHAGDGRMRWLKADLDGRNHDGPMSVLSWYGRADWHAGEVSFPGQRDFAMSLSKAMPKLTFALHCWDAGNDTGDVYCFRAGLPCIEPARPRYEVVVGVPVRLRADTPQQAAEDAAVIVLAAVAPHPCLTGHVVHGEPARLLKDDEDRLDNDIETGLED